MIFIRPHVIYLMQKDKGLSLLQATWKVVKSGTDISREVAVGTNNKNKNLRRKTTMKLDVTDDNRPVHVPPPNDVSSSRSSSRRPMSYVEKQSAGGGGEVVSSMGLESFQEDITIDEKNNAIHEVEDMRDIDIVMYGANDHDIFDCDDDGLSYGTIDFYNSDGISLMEEGEEGDNNSMLFS